MLGFLLKMTYITGPAKRACDFCDWSLYLWPITTSSFPNFELFKHLCLIAVNLSTYKIHVVLLHFFLLNAYIGCDFFFLIRAKAT